MKFSYLLFFVALCLPAFGQNETTLEKGVASYVSSLHVYVKFPSTEAIAKGDTLFCQKEGLSTPCLLVKDKSSTSCVCANLMAEKPKVGDEFFARVPKKQVKTEPAKPKKEAKSKSEKDTLPPSPPSVQTPETEEKQAPEYKQKIKGRLSAASYSTMYGDQETHRMRYAFTLQGNNIGNSRFSTDNYVTFRHTAGEWQAVQDNFSDALKIYSLSVKYDLDKKSSISVGRKINQKIASMGAIDGVQLEKGLGNFHLGAIAGSRPDYQDYGVNFNLMQAGAYLGHSLSGDGKFEQTTFALVEQRNGGSTDRRFAYFQHSNSLLKDLNLFGSFEIDLYENIHDEAKSKLSLTNLYLSVRYKVSQKLSLTTSFDSRKNIIYYESYKNYIDQLIDDETRQGLRFNINYRPTKLISWGANANWRFQKSDMNLSKNLNTYLNFSRIPWLKAYASVTANFLQTNYLKSKMFGLRMSKDIVPGKLSFEMYGRLVNYNYSTYDYAIWQKIVGADMSINLSRKLSFFIYYEGTFDNKNETLHRVNTKIMQRF
ncbi:MAG: hypothetical protein AAB316_05300 [Bacteroidota bacterium]